MNKIRRNKLMFRWSIITTVLIAIFWTMYYFIIGSVPIITSIKVTETYSLLLPFGISRWSDILIGPIYPIIIIYIIYCIDFYNKNKNKAIDYSILAFNMFICLYLSIMIGLIFNLLLKNTDLSFYIIHILDLSIIIGLASGLAYYLIFHLDLNLILGIFFGIALSLALSLTFLGIIFGLAYCLVFSLALSLALSLTFGLVYLIYNFKFIWIKIINWLIVKE